MVREELSLIERLAFNSLCPTLPEQIGSISFAQSQVRFSSCQICQGARILRDDDGKNDVKNEWAGGE